MVSGVLAGLSDKWNFDVTLVRFLFAIFTISNFGIGVIIYIILASILPTKEEIEAEMYGTGPRKRKEAEAIDDNDGRFWWVGFWNSLQTLSLILKEVRKRSEPLTLASARVFFLPFFYGKILIAKSLDIPQSYKNVRLKSLL